VIRVPSRSTHSGRDSAADSLNAALSVGSVDIATMRYTSLGRNGIKTDSRTGQVEYATLLKA
jgi:hypothetical protein